MAYFPLMVDLEGKNCIVVGGGKVAERKAKILRSFGASVKIIAPKIIGDFSSCEVCQKSFEIGDMGGAFLIVAATDKREENLRIAELASKKKMFANICDSIDESSIIFPAVYRDENLTIAVSTEGKSPFAAKYIRDWIRENLPNYILKGLQTISRQRKAIQSYGKNANEKYLEIIEGERLNEDRNEKK